MTGYSSKFVRLVNRAGDAPGVLLGKRCIELDISVIEIAEYFGVSRTAVYAWFTGQSQPKKVHEIKIHKFLKKKA
jgi:hypothetical protein